jgi:hypothetical protein
VFSGDSQELGHFALGEGERAVVVGAQGGQLGEGVFVEFQAPDLPGGFVEGVTITGVESGAEQGWQPQEVVDALAQLDQLCAVAEVAAQ